MNLHVRPRIGKYKQAPAAEIVILLQKCYIDRKYHGEEKRVVSQFKEVQNDTEHLFCTRNKTA